MASSSSTIGAIGADYATIALWISGVVNTTQNGDTAEGILLDATAEASTWLNHNQGSNWILRSNIPMTADGAGGTWIYSPNHGLRILSANTVTGGSCTFVIEGLRFADTNFPDWYEWSNVQGGRCAHTVTYKNCYWSGYNSSERPCRVYANQGVAVSVTWENCIWSDCRENGIALEHNTLAGSPVTLSIKGSTMVNSGLRITQTATMDISVTTLGCILDPYSTQSEIVLSGSGGSLALASNYCLFARSELDVLTLWDEPLNASYGVAMVTGAPAATEVGFANIATGDFTLYDSPNNLAIGYVVGGGMPSTDITGTTRPQGAYPDAGAYEVIVGDAPPPPISQLAKGLQTLRLRLRLL